MNAKIIAEKLIKIAKILIADTFWYHGTPSGVLYGSATGIHVGTKKAAQQALEARIGVPAHGSWDGSREYGKTLLAGKKKLGTYQKTGYNSDAPDEDYYPDGMATYSDGSRVALNARPKILTVAIKCNMTNTPYTPYSDSKANSMMKAQMSKGNARSGYYYKNDAEDVGSISAVVPNKDCLIVY